MTTNFSLSEFESKDGAETPLEVQHNLQKLAEELQILRDLWGKPITINSGYRSPVHNNRIGGGKNSQHLLGKAADIVVQGMTPNQVADAIEQLIEDEVVWFGGIGRYDTFTHIDTRDTRARWDYRSVK